MHITRWLLLTLICHFTVPSWVPPGAGCGRSSWRDDKRHTLGSAELIPCKDFISEDLAWVLQLQRYFWCKCEISVVEWHLTQPAIETFIQHRHLCHRVILAPKNHPYTGDKKGVRWGFTALLAIFQLYHGWDTNHGLYTLYLWWEINKGPKEVKRNIAQHMFCCSKKRVSISKTCFNIKII